MCFEKVQRTLLMNMGLYSSCNSEFIGKYRFIRYLSNGSFSQVVLGERDEKRYILKIIVSPKANPAQEIKLLKMIRECPGTTKYVEHFYYYEDVVIVTEYCDGEELFQVLAKGRRFPEKDAFKIFRNLCETMACVHSKGVAHRDLKPENIVIDLETLQVHIIDWGLAFDYVNDRELKWCGSPNYASPEMVSELQYIGPEVDMWSLGIILYTLVTARMPFPDDYPPALFKKIRRCEINYFVPGMTDRVEALLRKILVRDSRPSIAQVLEMLHI